MILLRATVSGRRPCTGTSMAVASKTTPRQSQEVQEVNQLMSAHCGAGLVVGVRMAINKCRSNSSFYSLLLSSSSSPFLPSHFFSFASTKLFSYSLFYDKLINFLLTTLNGNPATDEGLTLDRLLRNAEKIGFVNLPVSKTF